MARKAKITENRMLRRRARELQRRIDIAIDHVSACLFFLLIPASPGRKRPAHEQWQVDQQIRNYAAIGEGLLTGEWDHFSCEVCGQPITAGQAYTYDSEGGANFHSRCVGLKKQQTGRMPTHQENRAELRRRLDEARAHLMANSVIASAASHSRKPAKRKARG